MLDRAHPYEAASVAEEPAAEAGTTPADENAAATAEHDIGSAKTQVPQITLITKRDTQPLMSKRISLDREGKLKSDGSECRMITGSADRAFAATASALAQIIANCRSNQAIALGALKAELLASVAVTIPSRLDKHPGAITRSRSYIDYRPGAPAWRLIDFDTKGMPDEVKTKIDAAGGMWNALLTVAPGLASAPRVSRASTSAGLFRSDTGEPIAGSNGMHHYVLVADGNDVERLHHWGRKAKEGPMKPYLLMAMPSLILCAAAGVILMEMALLVSPD